MKFILSFLPCLLLSSVLSAQRSIDLNPFNNKEPRKLFQRNHGAIIGLQKGAGTSFELGYEAHWRKISLLKPHIIGATSNLEYNIANNVMGYKAGMWMKRGRINLTYGANLVYFTDFKGLNKYGIGPSVGFRLAGFHFMNGLNLLAGDKDFKANTLYASIRYYFPVQNKFTWDRKPKRKKESNGSKGGKEEKEEEKEEKKGIRKLLNL
jgi:hypothetical protein